MAEKTKKILKAIFWALIGIGSVGLIVMGTTTEEISGGIIAIDGAVIAISAVIAYILGKIKS